MFVTAAAFLIAVSGVFYLGWTTGHSAGVQTGKLTEQHRRGAVDCLNQQPAQANGTYPGSTKSDCIATVEGQVHLTNLRVSAANFTRQVDPISQKQLICAEIVIADVARTRTYGPGDFALAGPNLSTERALSVMTNGTRAFAHSQLPIHREFSFALIAKSVAFRANEESPSLVIE